MQNSINYKSLFRSILYIVSVLILIVYVKSTVSTIETTVNESETRLESKITKMSPETNNPSEKKLLSIKEASDLLGMEEKELRYIIQKENQYRSENRIMNGIPFPLVKMQGKEYVVTNKIDQWLNDVSEYGRDMYFN